MAIREFSRWASVLAMPAIAGCGAILGFHEAAPNGACGGPLDCAPDESCADGVCAPRCNSNTDCAGGRSCQPPTNGQPKACILPTSHPSDGGDGGDEEDAECPAGFADCDGASSGGCETNVSFDPNNCQVCGVVCQNSPCADGMCRSPLEVGYYGQGNLFVALLSNTIYAWHLTPLSQNGWLWKIGILVSGSTQGVPMRLAVYEDDGAGHPGNLVGQAALVSGMGSNGPTGSANEVVVPAPLPMLQHQVPYYVAVIAGTTDAGTGLVITANTGPTVTAFETNYVYAPDAGLPSPVTLPQMVMSSQANVYIVVAE